MRIDNPTVEGALSLPEGASASGSFSGSFEGDGSGLTGIIATDLDIDQFGDDLTGNTLAGTDKMILSDGGTEGRVNVSQLATPLAGTGLEANAGTVRIATAAAGDGLSGGGGSALAVNVDDSTIETNADTLRVKDSGVTNAKLANDSITFGATSQALGSTITTISGLTLISADTGTFVHQIFESSSTIITSGSNVFGNDAADTQQITGSILLTGSFIATAPGATINGDAIVTGSAQIDHDATTNFVANEHINHTSVTITAGNGLTGGGDISANRTINIGQGTGISVAADAISTNDGQIVHDNLSGYVANEHIDHTGVSITAGSGLTGGGTIAATRTINIGEGTGITVAADTISTNDGEIVHDNLSGFVADEHVAHSGVTFTAGNGLTGGGTIASSRTFAVGAGTLIDVTADAVNVDLSELSTSTTNGDGDYFVVVDTANAQRKLTKANIALSGFNNDSGWTSNVGDITGVTAGNGLTGGGSSGTVTLNIGAGTGIDVAADAISVDVSDFMSNGSNNRIVTATGTDAMNAEANLTFDGSTLTVAGTINETSARRFKENIVSLEDSLSKTLQLNPVEYDWIKDGKHDIGLIAEEVNEILPDLVYKEDGEIQGIHYSRLTAILIGAVKELTARVEELENK